ncbi:hypothetical protein Tco_1325365 [Tanacetum coccineum]
MYYPRFTKVIIHHFLIQDKTPYRKTRLETHTSKDDILIKPYQTCFPEKKASQIYGAVLPECLTSPEIKESKAYKTYLGHATCVVPPKIARKFKKVYSTVFRETPVKTKSTGKEKVDVSRRKGIDLLSKVALNEKALLKEVRKKSLRDFYKTHPSGSGIVAEKPPSDEKITPAATSEGTSDKPRVPDVTANDSTESESKSWEKEDESDDDNQEEGEVDQENEFEYDEIESDEDKGMGDTTDQFDDDEDARLEESTQTGKEVVQGECANKQCSTVTKKTEVPVTSSSRSSDLASKFLNFSDIPHTDAEIVSPFDVPVQHEVPNIQTTTLLPIHVSVITTIPQSLHTFTPPPLMSTPTPPPTTEATNPLSTLPDFASVFRFNNRIIALEKEVAELKKDPLQKHFSK